MSGFLRGSNSRAASTQTEQQDAIVTEIVNGLIVSKPAKKIIDISESKTSNQSEPEIIDLQEYARSGKAASVHGINKVRAIHDFINNHL